VTITTEASSSKRQKTIKINDLELETQSKVSAALTVFLLCRNRTASLPNSTFKRIIVITTVRATERTTATSGLSHSEKVVLVQCSQKCTNHSNQKLSNKKHQKELRRAILRAQKAHRLIWNWRHSSQEKKTLNMG